MFWYLLLQNTCVWLQWLGFEGKHAVLCIRGSNHHQALIRNMLAFQQSPTWVIKSMYFTSNMSYIGEISPFFIQKWPVFGATLLRVFGEISLISPQNRIYCCVPLNHCIKLKFYAFCVFAVANYVFCGIFITKCQIPCYM